MDAVIEITISLLTFGVLTIRFIGERGTDNLEFGQEVSKVWSRIVPANDHETMVVVFMINYFLIVASHCYV